MPGDELTKVTNAPSEMPLKMTVPVPGIKLPLSVQLPAILMLVAVPALRVVPGPMIKL